MNAAITSATPDSISAMEAHAQATLDLARKRLESAKTIPEVLTVLAMAEAVAGIQRRLNVSEAQQRIALRLALDAEVELGKLCLEMPTAPRGAVVPGTSRPKSKGAYLADLGVSATRVSGAQRLAQVPAAQIESAFARSKTITGVKKAIGIHVGSVHVSQTTERALGFLADEAIALLERIADGSALPHPGTIKELRTRLDRIRGTKR